MAILKVTFIHSQFRFCSVQFGHIWELTNVGNLAHITGKYAVFATNISKYLKICINNDCYKERYQINDHIMSNNAYFDVK